MRFVIFTHSLVSDWNHGNAHFLRGIASELIARGHTVDVFEPAHGWSRENLIAEQGTDPLTEFAAIYPLLHSTLYEENHLNLDSVLNAADVVLVHEWNSPSLVSAIGRHRSQNDYQLFFHDTHHRILTDEAGISSFDLAHYDGVLAYGAVIRDAYLAKGVAKQAWTWHEAADTRAFHPLPAVQKEADLVWVGNWGDNERAETLREFLVKPVKELSLKARVYGVRYPEQALNELADAGIEYRGWTPNYRVPEIFARHRVTVHVPRLPYIDKLPGIPTIRPFEALACGIPLVSAPWRDVEGLFSPGKDFLFAQSGLEMTRALDKLLGDEDFARRLSSHGLNTIIQRHTCAHRVDELLALIGESCRLPSLVQA